MNNEIEGKTFAQMAEEYEASRSKKIRNPVWGEWTYEHKSGCLCYQLDGDSDTYHVAIFKIKRSAHILDWIFQLNDKTWMTPQAMKDFLEAINFLLYPQGNYCSWGQDLECKANEILDEMFGEQL